MDIKLKSKIIYIITFIIAIYLVAFAILAGVDIKYQKEFLNKDAFFVSYNFKEAIDDNVNNLKRYYLYFNNYDKRTDKDKVTEEEIKLQTKKDEEEKQKKIEAIRDEYSEEINENYYNLNLPKLNALVAERDKKISDIENNSEDKNKAEERIRKKAIEEKDKEYLILKEKVLNKENFIKYYFRNKNTGEIYTNIEKDIDIKKYIEEALYSINLPNYNKNYFTTNIDNSIDELNWDGYFIVPKTMNENSQLYKDYMYYASVGERVYIEVCIFIIILILIIIASFYLYRNRINTPLLFEKARNLLKKIPLDIRGIIFIAYSWIILRYISNVEFFYFLLSIEHIKKLTFIVVYIFYTYLSIKELIIIKESKEDFKNQWSNSLIYKFKVIIKEFSTYKGFLFKLLFINILTIGFVISAIVIFDSTDSNKIILCSIYDIIYLFVIVPRILEKISLLNRINKGTEEILYGNFDYTIEVKGKGKSGLEKLAHNINNIKASSKIALDNQMKSERLKSELITNVSHDLKTPLTSIVNYIDLLRNENLSKDDIRKYVKILEKKSQRLKILIEDLFEASKMSSGDVELSLQKVDLVALLKQALGEYDEKIKNSSISFKLNIEKQNIYAYLDGMKTWRVFDNLINNALKYSEDNTRVYLSLEEKDNKAVFIIKNISNYELDFEPNEIFERFKRGDKSRNTEGSGLGLAIAKSIVDIQGGTLDIEIDGDLFKVIVKFPQ
ncbi:his Kinase A domain protein [Clostridium argentinense CDC 2741]|uniref:histidine kinase n=1 Tax=Clostridium argentinense CDC 2741 TaxID=1418104 RepID=A0A0C1TVU0_9CLOT|nr:HAMP domain-containing sensor histidine kinase [Clostridium argentinense]KIE44864.1 his Kinase A domain protein [Clostridium argentinense CDC 2741]NFF38308.1 HAMP domain-containing histidine kinase [Clostridium argentinense]NFP49108.1 HAMP domain-containing histidine kinase [Clostridium argentinense]NFP71612.1 HAMP domain-containing histidine kinase [Clostridium argentinense]NFP74997.1 HAMP domain-containing histidine kinase [Clostridium argentinense]